MSTLVGSANHGAQRRFAIFGRIDVRTGLMAGRYGFGERSAVTLGCPLERPSLGLGGGGGSRTLSVDLGAAPLLPRALHSNRLKCRLARTVRSATESRNAEITRPPDQGVPDSTSSIRVLPRGR